MVETAEIKPLQGKQRLRVCVVCSSNNNRSMEAHCVLVRHGWKVRSFGTGNFVRLPGANRYEQNVFSFETTYDHMYTLLKEKNEQLYQSTGILKMLDRNRNCKPHPERFQDCYERFDVVIACEERVFDQICEDLASREQDGTEWVHVINIDIKDNHEEAAIGAEHIYELLEMMNASDDLDSDIEGILLEFYHRFGRPLMHHVGFY